MNTRISLKPSVRAALVLMLLGLALVLRTATAQQVVTGQPWYIYSQPPNAIVSDASTATISFIFAAGTNGDSATPPQVSWYLNNNFVSSGPATVQTRVVDAATGQVKWGFYDPFTNSATLPAATATPAGPTSRVLWNCSLTIPSTAPGIYTASVDTSTVNDSVAFTTNACQVSFTPNKAVLPIVAAPTDQYKSFGGELRMMGDAQSHVGAILRNPFGAVVDGEGLIYIADTFNHAIRRITPGGHVETVAGIDGQPIAVTSYDPPVGLSFGGSISMGSGLNVGTLVVDDPSLISVGQQLTALNWNSMTLGGTAFSKGTLYTGGSLRVTSVNLSYGTIGVTGTINMSATGVTFEVRSGTATATGGGTGGRRMILERSPAWGPPLDTERTIGVVSRQNAAKDGLSYRSTLLTTVNGTLYTSLNASEPKFNAPEALTAADDTPASIYVADTGNNTIRRLESIEKNAVRVDSGTAIFVKTGDTVVRNLYINPSMQYSNAYSLTNSGTVASGTVALVQPRGIVFKRSLKSPTKIPVLYVLDGYSVKRLELNSYSNSTINAGTAISGVAYIGSVKQAPGWRPDSASTPTLNDSARFYAPRGIVVEKDSYDAAPPVLYVADTINHVIRRLTLPLLNASGLTTTQGSLALKAGLSGTGLNGLVGSSDADAAGVMYVRGDNIPDGTYITSVNGGTAFLSASATASGTTSLSVSNITVNGGSFIANTGTLSTIQLSGTLGLSPGMLVAGPNFKDGSRITRVNNSPNQVEVISTLSGGTHAVIISGTTALQPFVVLKDITTAGPSDWKSDVVAGVVGSKGTVDGTTGYFPNLVTKSKRIDLTANIARLNYPAGLCADKYGNLYFTELGSHTVRKVTFDASNGDISAQVSTVAGTGQPGPFDNTTGEGTGTRAQFYYPMGIALDTRSTTSTSLFVADVSNHVIREITDSTSTTLAGFVGVPGNRDFAYEMTEYFYQWLRLGIPVQSFWRYPGPQGYDFRLLRLSSLTTDDAGPYELSITNRFGSKGQTPQNTVYVAPNEVDALGNPISEQDAAPKFLDPGYTVLSSTGGTLANIRPDPYTNAGFTIRAYIVPADQVDYQWQVAKVTTDGSSPVWYSLQDTPMTLGAELQALLGKSGSSSGINSLAISGAQTSTLSITGLQRSLAATNQPLPQLQFRVYATTKNPLNTSLDTSVNTTYQIDKMLVRDDNGIAFSTTTAAPSAINVSPEFGVILTGGTVDSPVAGNATPNPFKYVKVTQDTLAAGVPLDLVGASIQSFPRVVGEDPFNPTMGVKYQWMYQSADKDPVRDTWTAVSSPADVPVSYTTPGGVYNFLPFSATNYGRYRIHMWTGSGAFTSGPSTIQSRNADGSVTDGYAKSESFSILPAARPNIDAITPNQSPFKFVNIPTTGSVTLKADITNASDLPAYKWWFRSWANRYKDNNSIATPDTPGSGWVLLVDGGTLQSGFPYMAPQATAATPNTAGIAIDSGTSTFPKVSDTINSGSLTFTFPTSTTPDMADSLSGQYMLEAVIPPITVGSVSYPATSFYSPIWTVGVRYAPVAQSPSPTPYGFSVGGTITSGTLTGGRTVSTPYTIRLNDGLSASLSAALRIPLPDADPVGISGADLPGTPLQYVWRRDRIEVKKGANATPVQTVINSSPLGNDISCKLLFNRVTEQDLGLYTLDVKNDAGALFNLGLTSNSSSTVGWELRGDTLPMILGTPTARTPLGLALVTDGTQRAISGKDVSLEIPVQSPANLKYIWRKVGSSRPDIITYTNRLLIRNADPVLDSGTYQVFIVNTLTSGSLTFNGGYPTVNLMVEAMPAYPAITPTTATLLTGSTLSLRAYSSGTGTLYSGSQRTSNFTFQWKKDGVSIGGQTAETLQIPNVSRAQAGAYTVEVRSAAGAIISPIPSVVTVSAGTVADTAYKVTLVNADTLRKTTSILLVNGTANVLPGTKVTLTGASTTTQTMLGWRVCDELGHVWDLPPVGAQFIMPASNVTIQANLGRSLSGNYTGFVGLQKPWDPSIEWAKPNNADVSASKVRGYFTCSLTPLGTLSGKLLLEGKTYAVNSYLTWLSDTVYGAKLQFRQSLVDGSSRIVSGKAVVNMGFKTFCYTPTSTAGATSTVHVDRTTGLALDFSVSGPGVPEGTTIVDIGVEGAADGGRTALTLSSPVTLPAAGAALIFGTAEAQDDNILHVTLDDVVLEKTPPKVVSGQSLYGTAAGSRGTYKVLKDFMVADSPDLPGNPPTIFNDSTKFNPRFTAAIYRFAAGDLDTGFGRGGVLSAQIFATGVATVTGYLPNGSKISFSGYTGRAIYSDPAETVGPDDPKVPALRPVGPADLFGSGFTVMEDAIKRVSGSISIPIWPFSPVADSPSQPLFGALSLSGLKVDGCLGSLNQKPNYDTSEYTYNYAEGWYYDSTFPGNAIRPVPFASASTISMVFTSSQGVQRIPLLDSNAGVTLTTGASPISIGGNTSTFPLISGSGAVVAAGSFSLAANETKFDSGLISGSMLERTTDYSGITTPWMRTSTAPVVNCGLYAVIIQAGQSALTDDKGLPLSTSPTNADNGGAPGFLLRGLTMTSEKWISLLGNQSQTGYKKDSKTTFRNEAIMLLNSQ